MNGYIFSIFWPGDGGYGNILIFQDVFKKRSSGGKIGGLGLNWLPGD